MSSITLPGVTAYESLKAAAATGVGTAVSMPDNAGNAALQVNFTGFSAVTVTLEGTIDGVNYFTLATFTQALGTGGIVFITGKLVVAVRANATVLTGTGTVDAWIAV